MCEQVVLTGRGADVFCDTVGELEDALGGTVFMRDGYPITPDWRRFCLCSLDDKKTAAAYGYDVLGHTSTGEWESWSEWRSNVL